MRSKVYIILLIIGVLIAMGIFSFLKQKKSEDLIYRLVWFELQIAPASYRFAIMPEQPILIGFEGEGGEKGATMLIRYEHVPDVYERTVEKVDAIVKKSGILSLHPSNPHLVFSDATMTEPSIHIRIAYADQTQWAGFYSLEDAPTSVIALVRDTKALAKQIMQRQSSETIDGNTAHEFLDPEKNTAQQESSSIVVKIKVHMSGKISANGQEVTMSELGEILDDLKQENGEVWYYRESPDQEPPESLDEVIKGVLDAIMSRNLPVRLQQEEY